MRGKVVRVLVLDNEVKTGRSLCAVLARGGYHTRRSASLKGGMRLLRQQQFQILILDLELAGPEGMGIVKRLRSEHDGLAVILLNSAPSVDLAVISIKSGAHSYIQKPVGTCKLLDTVEDIVSELGLREKPGNKLFLAIGSKLREIRQRQRLTLRQVAQRTGLSVSLLSQIERAESAASIASLYKIAEALKVTLKILFEGF